jgi:hypothetical protein
MSTQQNAVAGAALAELARNQKFRLIDTVQYPGNGVAAGVAAPTRTELPRTFVYQDLNLRFAGDLTIAGGAADGVLTPEQPLSLIRDIRIEASSGVRPSVGILKRADAAALFRLQHFLKGVQGELTVLALPGVQAASPINFDIEIDFELTRSADPRLTLLNTRELTSLDLVIDWGIPEDIENGGDRVKTINNMACTVSGREFLDPQSIIDRYGLHQTQFIERNITAATVRFPINLKRGFLLRGFLIKQFTQAAVNFHTPVATILNQVAIEVNREEKLRYNSFALLQADNKYTYKIEVMPAGYAFVDILQEGRLDTMIDTRDFEDVEVVLDVNAIANGRIRIYPIEIIPSQ